MFSYRHAFHAGNHADVLKHTALIATLRHLVQKDVGLTVVDTHAGAGLYRLDGEYAATSGEAAQGFERLLQAPQPLSAALRDYVDMVATFNRPGQMRIYPGSPFLMHRLLRSQDRLKLFEMHPTDARTLAGHVAQLEAGRQVAVLREDGFAGLQRLLPPPSRRALVLCDPSYEIKSDYAKVPEAMADALKRFATGTCMVWHPIIPRPEAHDLPRRLRAVATRAGRPWLSAQLTVKSGRAPLGASDLAKRPGLPASGIFVINPPHTLQAALREALPVMAELLGQDTHAAFDLQQAP